MNLLELATWICQKHESTDTTSLARAKSFLQQRWAFIWNRHLWRESKGFATVAVSAGAQTVTLPSAAKAVLAVRWAGNRHLEAMEIENVLRLAPQVWDQQGEPYGYSIMAKDGSGNLEIRLLSAHADAEDLLVVYKRDVPAFTADNHSPTLLGIDQALLAFAEGDFLEYRRQFGKAQVKHEEGGAMLQTMIEMEIAQTVATRSLKPMVSGWLTQHATLIANKHQHTDALAVDRIKEFLKNRWAFIWNHSLWRESKAFATVAVAASAETVLMPPEAKAILALRWADTLELTPMELETVLRVAPQSWDQLGEPYGYSILAKTAEGRLQVRLFRGPREAKDLLVIYKKAVPPLDDENDPTLLGIDQALLAFAEGDFLDYLKSADMAQMKFQEGGTMLQTMLDLETQQTATTRRFLPDDGEWMSSDPDCW